MLANISSTKSMNTYYLMFLCLRPTKGKMPLTYDAGNLVYITLYINDI
jgi:hypothetical protein